jgi:hypothetical protein
VLLIISMIFERLVIPGKMTKLESIVYTSSALGEASVGDEQDLEERNASAMNALYPMATMLVVVNEARE